MAKFVLIENSIDLVDDKDFFDKVALVAHNCYQVAAKDHLSNIAFIGRLITGGHFAMIEHYRYLFKVSKEMYDLALNLNSPFLTLVKGKKNLYLSCSVRPLLEAKKYEEIQLASYLISALPEEVRTNVFPQAKLTESTAEIVDVDAIKSELGEEDYDKVKFVTYHLITDRGVTHEIVRHRLCSFAQESTRYCNYTKDKFSNELAFMKPLRYDDFKDIYDKFYQEVSDTYFELINKGAKPDEARSVLPNSLRASIMVTCSLTEWKHIFELRCSDFAHPDIHRLMDLVRKDMEAKAIL